MSHRKFSNLRKRGKKLGSKKNRRKAERGAATIIMVAV